MDTLRSRGALRPSAAASDGPGYGDAASAAAALGSPCRLRRPLRPVPVVLRGRGPAPVAVCIVTVAQSALNHQQTRLELESRGFSEANVPRLGLRD